MPDTVTFPAAARWIWSADARRLYNNIVSFRCEFDVAGDVRSGSEAEAPSLLITADSRYELFVNGRWLGHGPARSWPSPWPADPYDLRGLLRPGRNVIAVLVQHYGISTFQYLHAAPGLLAHLRWTDEGGVHERVTDDSGAWRALPNPAHLWPVPRISCMQAWEEQYDARAFPADWREPDFSAGDWPVATASHPAGEGEHDRFVLRDIPQLTREPVGPVCVRGIEAVRPAPYTWNLNPRAFLTATDLSANHVRGDMLLLTHIFSERPQAIELHQPHGRPFLEWTLNGRPVAFDDHSLHPTDTGVARLRLKAGWNPLMGRLPPCDHYWWAVINAWTAHPVRWSARPDDAAADSSAWLAVGPFGETVRHAREIVDADAVLDGATSARFEEIRRRGSLLASELSAAYVRPLTPDMVAAADVYALCASERILPGITPRAENLSALQHDTADWAVIHRVNDHRGHAADVRILLDFGREVIGWHEFEIDAPAGTILDNHNFEFIQPDGRHNLAESMNNSFRYICAEGVQRYRTVIRRGFQYSWITLRNFDRPVRIRHIRLLLSTYPQERRGAFACSDAWLDRIWEAGAHSVRCCSEDTYTDCPSYEQTFWVGDARNEALVDLVANGDPRLSAHSWRIVAQSFARSDFGESQVPSGWQNVLPTWSFLWMRWGEEHYRLTGDRSLGLEMIRSYERIAGDIARHLSPRGLLKVEGWILFDWAPMDTPSNGEVTHLNCLAVLGLRQAADLASALGRETAPLAKKWHALADAIAAAVNAHLWDSRKRAYIDCIRPDGSRSAVFSQQTHTAACIAGVPTPARARRTREIMACAPGDFVRAGSPFFMFFVLECLARERRGTELTALIRDYWGKQVKAGATTFWEMYHENQPRMTRSHCHGWSAAPTYFLSACVLGVQPARPGYATVLVAPQTGDLSWARGRVPTPRGTVEVSWEKHPDGRFELRAELPPGLPAEIELPPEFTRRKARMKVLAGKVRASAAFATGTARRLRATGSRIHLVVG